MSIETLQFREVSVDEYDESLCDELCEFLSNNSDDFSSSLIGDLSHIDQRAHNYNGITIHHVSYEHGFNFSFEYSYQYHIYNGCSDMDIDSEETETANFSLSLDGTIEINTPDISNLRGNRIYED